MALLDGKVAFITGAARGQGRAHAVTLAGEGADIVAVDVTGAVPPVQYPLGTIDELEETGKLVEALGRRAVVRTADVRSQEQLDAAVEDALHTFGQIDILVANAGVWDLGPVWELTEQQWDTVVGTNLTGVWKSVKAVVPHMRERRTGAIVMTSSVNGVEAGENSAHYAAAKHGVIGLMRAVALELAPYGIRCNAVMPGAIDTPMNDWQGARDAFAGHPDGTPADRVAAGHSYHALAGAGLLDPQVVADAVLWLVSPRAAAVTGAAIPVDAGHLLLPGVSATP
jgi:SDR family mycofactocin-dependent oxidoreductase